MTQSPAFKGSADRDDCSFNNATPQLCEMSLWQVTLYQACGPKPPKNVGVSTGPKITKSIGCDSRFQRVDNDKMIQNGKTIKIPGKNVVAPFFNKKITWGALEVPSSDGDPVSRDTPMPAPTTIRVSKPQTFLIERPAVDAQIWLGANSNWKNCADEWFPIPKIANNGEFIREFDKENHSN